MGAAVIIAWAKSAEDVSEGRVSVLVYSNGAPRIYERDNVDARVHERGAPPPYCATLAEMNAALTENPQRGVQLDVREARNIGLL